MSEHPFAPFIRILGRGPSFIRDLTEAEARDAFAMVLDGTAEPLQVGAFLMLMRYKSESPAELAGFVRAVRDGLALPEPAPVVDVDWPSYAAGRTRGLPWFVLAALLLASNGIKVFLHGSNSYQSAGQPTGQALEALGIPASATLTEAAQRLAEHNIAQAPLEAFCPPLHAILSLRPLLGLRSPANSICRSLNPFRARALVLGVFHPGFRDIHQEAAALLDQPRMGALKGGGGEFERNPAKTCSLRFVRDGILGEEEWQPLPRDADAPAEQPTDLGALAALWRGDIEDARATATVIGTAAIVLRMLDRAATPEEAEAMAATLWRDRPRARVGAV